MLKMPAEWEAHEATWLAWPHNPETWPGRLKFIPQVWIQMIKALHVHETVHLLVNDTEMEKGVQLRLQRADIDLTKVRFHKIPTNDCWLRDSGPTFVRTVSDLSDRSDSSDKKIAAVCWIFNSWGEKWPPWNLDQEVSRRVVQSIGLSGLEPGIVLEGGSIEVNGEGVLLTTESCLLKRNSHLRKEDIEKHLISFLGVKKIIWLTGSPPQGDDTDGHIDNLARFVSSGTIVAPLSKDSSDPDHLSQAENLEALKKGTALSGKSFSVIPLPSPRVLGPDQRKLPASYANFYIANGVVLLPVFHVPEDEEAIRILKPHFPKRRIVPIDVRDLVIGFGGIHCVTQQQPA